MLKFQHVDHGQNLTNFYRKFPSISFYSIMRGSNGATVKIGRESRLAENKRINRFSFFLFLRFSRGDVCQFDDHQRDPFGRGTAWNGRFRGIRVLFHRTLVQVNA